MKATIQFEGVYTAIFGLFLLFGFGCAPSESADEVASKRLLAHVEALASPAMEGRETGTHGELLASAWLDSVFNSIDLVARGDSGSIQTFHYKPHPPMQMHGMGDSAVLGMALVQEIECFVFEQ